MFTLPTIFNFLNLHLIGTFVMGIMIVSSLLALFLRKSSFYRFFAISIAFGTAFQLITGSLLAMAQQAPASLLGFCSRIGIYMTVVLIMETMLFMKIRENSKMAFPLKTTISSLTVGMVVVIITIVTLY